MLIPPKMLLENRELDHFWGFDEDGLPVVKDRAPDSVRKAVEEWRRDLEESAASSKESVVFW